MYVCLCVGITDQQAREAIEHGGRNPGEIIRACGSARLCGGCTPTLRELLQQAQDGVVTMDDYREAR